MHSGLARSTSFKCKSQRHRGLIWAFSCAFVRWNGARHATGTQETALKEWIKRQIKPLTKTQQISCSVRCLCWEIGLFHLENPLTQVPFDCHLLGLWLLRWSLICHPLLNICPVPNIVWGAEDTKVGKAPTPNRSSFAILIYYHLLSRLGHIVILIKRQRFTKV